LTHPTSADVPASTDVTRHASRGVDWMLERAMGRIETDFGFGAAA